MNDGKKIRLAIAARGLTITTFARCIGVSRTAVYSWLSGRLRPRGDRREIIAAILGVSRAWLFDGGRHE